MAEENQNQDENTETKDTENEQEHQSTESRNVDQKELREKLGKVDELSDAVSKLLEAQKDSKPAEKSEDNEPSEIDALRAELNAQKRNGLVGYVNEQAKANGYAVNDIATFLVGDDQDATKANFDKFNDFIKAHDDALKKSLVTSTDSGFNTTRGSKLGESKDFLNSMLDEQFGSAK